MAARDGRPVPGESGPEGLGPVRAAVLSDPSPVTGARVAEALRSSGRLLGTTGALEAVDALTADLRGLGPLQKLAGSERVTDILVNGPDQVWTDGEDGLLHAPVAFGSDAEVRALAARLIAAGGRRLDESCPCADVQLDGYRVHAVLPPVSAGGTLLSIRIRRRRGFPLAELLSGGPWWQQYVEAIVTQRLNFLISGATGSGKTTLLSAMLGLAGSRERLVLVEDAGELDPPHPHVVALRTRHSNVEGAGTVDLGELVRQALRMRPDRLVVGECRGAEVADFLAAMNTGHAGAGGTIHANSAHAVPARLAAMGALAGLSREALALQAGSALDLVIHLERGPTGRRVQEVALLRPAGAGNLEAVPALINAAGGVGFGPGWAALAGRLFPGPDPGKVPGS